MFVYGIGRFLRLSVSNLRMRIPFEDLPNTRRLVALCQVGERCMQLLCICVVFSNVQLGSRRWLAGY